MRAEVSRSRPPIFIQAMWRTGSTYVWNKFREQRQYRAYYEPLHECLVKSKEEVWAASGPEKQIALRHPEISDFYFSEFPFTAKGGVEGFHKSLSYERYCLHPNDTDEELRCYIAGLIDHAAHNGQTAVLQFNRGLLRAGWLARHFSPVQILILRKPMDVWKSFARFAQHPFETYLAIVLGQNRDKFPLAQLPNWQDFPGIVSDTFEKESVACASFADANQEFMYPSFFDFYVTATLHCVQFCDCILDLDGITLDAKIREAAEARLERFGIRVDLRDCVLPAYSAGTADGEWVAYERFAKRFLTKKLALDLTITEEMLAANQALLSEYFRELLSHFVQGRAQATVAVSSGPTSSRIRNTRPRCGCFKIGRFRKRPKFLGNR